MLQTVLKEGSPAIPIWIDATDPTSEELYGIAENYQIHPALVKDCLDPVHLPKHEAHGEATFLIFRYYDEACTQKKISVQAMTRKLAFFLGDRFLISVHRRPEPFIETVKEKYVNSDGKVYLQVVLLETLSAAIQTYQKPLEEMEAMIHGFEARVLRNQHTMANWEDVYRTKCRLTIIKRLFWHSLDALHKFAPSYDRNQTVLQDVIERIESLRFFADSLLDDLTSLLNIQLSLATHRANEESHRANTVMKVLTIFSAFFLPLNFIVGIYGMNFENMPELKHPYGYAAVWGVLISTVILIYSWFVRKGWIRWGHMS